MNKLAKDLAQVEIFTIVGEPLRLWVFIGPYPNGLYAQDPFTFSRLRALTGEEPVELLAVDQSVSVQSSTPGSFEGRVRRALEYLPRDLERLREAAP